MSSITVPTNDGWRPWSSAPKDGTLVFCLLANLEVWVGKWQPDGQPIPDGYVAQNRDEYTLAWKPMPESMQAEYQAKIAALVSD